MGLIMVWVGLNRNKSWCGLVWKIINHGVGKFWVGIILVWDKSLLVWPGRIGGVELIVVG